MPQKELTGIRVPTYSVWHRTDSIKRFTYGDDFRASRMTMIDLDAVYVEAKHPYDRPPVAIMETFEAFHPLNDQSTLRKHAGITFQLAQAANIPAFKVAYLASLRPNPAEVMVQDIEQFAVQQLYPVNDKRASVFSPQEYVEWLLWLRQEHVRVKRNGYQLTLPSPAWNEDMNDVMARWQHIIRKRFA